MCINQLTDNGVNGQVGAHAQSLVDPELGQGIGPAITRLPLTAALTVPEIVRTCKAAMTSDAQVCIPIRKHTQKHTHTVTCNLLIII